MGLPVDAPALPAPVADRLEHHVRRLGIPLDAAEEVAEDLDAAEDFLAACEAGRGREHAARILGEDGADEDPVLRVRIRRDPRGTAPA